MAAPIQVKFVVAGTDVVGRAFDTIERRAQRHEQFQAKAARDDVVRTRRTVDEKERAFGKLARETEKWKRQEQREADKAASAEVKAAEKAASAKLRAEEAWARQRARIVENSAKMAFRAAEQEVAAVEKAERAKASARERWARSTGARWGGRVGSSVGGLIGTAGNLAGMALTIGGGFGIANAVQSQFAAQRAAAQLVNAVTASGAAPAGASVANVMSQAGSIAIKTGMSQESVINGMLAYSRSARGGDFAGVQANAEFFAKMSKATGTSITDLASAAGVLQSQNADLTKDPAAMQQLLLTAYAQSKSGSVSLSDAAKQFGVLGSTRGLFQGNEARNQATLLGLGQIAAAGGSSEEIGTYIKDFSTEIAQKRFHTSKELGFGGRGLESLGVHFDKSGRMESPEQAIGAIMKATGGDLGKIVGLVGKRGLPLFSELQKSFLGAGGGDAGVAAVTKQIHSVTQSSMSSADLDKQFEQVMSTPAEKLGKSLEEVKIKLGEALMPALTRLADFLSRDDVQRDLQKLIDALEKAIEFLGDNPWKGLGLIIAGKITKDLAAAAIGDAVKKTLVSLLSGGKTPVPGGGVPGGRGSIATSAAMAGGTAAAVYSGFHLYDAAQRAHSTQQNGGNVFRSAYSYLDEWQSGGAGLVGGAKFNPLITLAKMASFELGDAGKIEAGENFHPGSRSGAPMQASHDETTDLLRQIARNTSATTGAGGPSIHDRTHPLGASRGATQ